MNTSQLNNSERDHAMPFTPLSEDELLALLLIHTWTLTTGKTLRCDVPPQELTEEELIEFWSDDHLDPTARHRVGLYSCPTPMSCRSRTARLGEGANGSG
jgi:hypothetical protein